MDYKKEIRSWLRMHKANAYCDLNPCLRCQLADHMLVEPTNMEEAQEWYRKARRLYIGAEIENDDVLDYITDVLQVASLKY